MSFLAQLGPAHGALDFNHMHIIKGHTGDFLKVHSKASLFYHVCIQINPRCIDPLLLVLGYVPECV